MAGTARVGSSSETRWPAPAIMRKRTARGALARRACGPRVPGPGRPCSQRQCGV